MEVSVHLDDLAQLTEFLDGTADDPETYREEADKNGGVVTLEMEECNYGLHSQRESAAHAGLAFFGWHDAGGEYGPYRFAAVGGVMEEHPTDHDGYLAIRVDEEEVMHHDIDVQFAPIEQVQEYIRHSRKAKAAVRREEN
jgi:hypothetical protein